MRLDAKRIGIALTGSHCNLELAMSPIIELVSRGAIVVPILSEPVAALDTRFGTASSWRRRVREIAWREPLTSIPEVEPIGPERLLDALAVCPCTGNTMAKIANAVTDGVVPMAAKAHLRNGRPLVLAISTNDGLGLNAKNLGLLLAARSVFFVPFGQDDARAKPTSLIADFSLLADTIEAALDGRQVQPLLLGPR
jgi:dipicolinate synthase subunit B